LEKSFVVSFWLLDRGRRVGGLFGQNHEAKTEKVRNPDLGKKEERTGKLVRGGRDPAWDRRTFGMVRSFVLSWGGLDASSVGVGLLKTKRKRAGGRPQKGKKKEGGLQKRRA